MTLSAGTRLGPYEVNAPLGKGGMGEVYRAHDTRLDRTVAVKVLPAESMRNAGRVQRFEKEAKAASARNHPNILTIYDFGVAENTYYIAMEFVEGETLRQMIDGDFVPLTRVVDIAVQCASGLAAAHAAGIVHRDIKPDNIMVRPDGYVKILDFGLAKLAEKPFTAVDADALTAAGGLTAPGMIMGTWLYMSPEQARGLELDARTDIWSMGVVLYELVARKSPFAAQTMSDTLAAILNREPEALSSFGVAVPDSLNHILAKAMVKNREERYQSIKDMELDLIQLRRELEAGKTRKDKIAAPENGERRTQVSGEKRGMSRGKKRSLYASAGVLAAALILWGVMSNRPIVTPAAPVVPSTSQVPAEEKRELSYSVLVRKTRNGEVHRYSGGEQFANGAKVQFDFSIPQAGSLYVLNDGPGPDGKQELNLEFPTPKVNNGSAQVMAYKSVQTEPLQLDNHPGREKFWVIWSNKPVPELEQSIQEVYKSKDPVIRDANLMQSIRALLAKSVVATVNVDHENKQTSLSGHGDVLVSEMDLDHH